MQEFFICDWWFNFDCDSAEEFYTKNDENAAEAAVIDARAAENAAEGEGAGAGADGMLKYLELFLCIIN